MKKLITVLLIITFGMLGCIPIVNMDCNKYKLDEPQVVEAEQPMTDEDIMARASGVGASTKLSDLAELSATPADSDELYINDGGTSKKIQYSNLMDGEALKDDSVDDDSIDFSDVTLVDITFDVGGVSTTEFGYLNNVSSAIQTQLDAKAATSQKLDDFGTPDDNTDLDVSTTAHGLTPKLNNNASTWLNGQGSWSAPSGSGDVIDVGDCADGACQDGTSDGGTYLRLYDGNSHYLEINPGDIAANETFDPTDDSGTGSWARVGSPTFTTNLTVPQVTLSGSDASPDAAGEMRYDSTVSGMSGGALRWYDNNSVRMVVDLETDPSNDDYVVTYDAAADGFYMKADADTGGNTVYDDIADPDASASISFGAYTGTYTSATEAWGGLIIESTDVDNAGDTTLLTLKHYDDYDENSIFLNLINDADSGAETILKVTGLGVYIGDGSPTQTMTGDDLYVSGFIQAAGIVYAENGMISSSATPKATLDDSDGADGYWDVNAADANDAVATFGVDDSGGDDQSYIELDGVNERIEIKDTLYAEDIVLLGDGGDTVTINSSDWDITSTGAITGVSIDADGSGNSITNIESVDIKDDGVDSADYATDSIDNEHINWANIANLDNDGAIVSADESTDTSCYVGYVTATTGSALKTGTNLTFNSATGLLATTTVNADLYDAVGAVDLDIGSVDITDVTVATDGGTVIIDGAITALGEDLGSTTAEWNDLFLNDGGVINLGNDQDVTITHVADTGILINLEVEIDGTLDADGVVALGDGGDNFSVASDGIDIDTSGNLTNVGTIGSGAIVSTGDVTANGNDVVIGTAAAGVTLTGDGDGQLTIGGFGDGTDENITINLDDTADTAVFDSGTSVATFDFTAINLVTTGTILGAINVVVTTDGALSPTAAQMNGTFFVADNATAANDTDYTLPTAVAGMCGCFYDNGAGTGGVIVDASASDDILLNGTSNGVAEAIDSPGVAGDGANGDFICLLAIDAVSWVTLGRSGTWVGGGAD